MDKQIAAVIKGFDSLSSSQQQEFIRKITAYIEGNYETKSLIIQESKQYLIRVDAGPLPGGCPCCGR
jgi:hypothetical protein